MNKININYNPLVSIVIPVYNGGKYLKYAIDCALNQTYANIEIIVVNDGSTDNGEVEKIAKSYGNKIRYFYKENGGVSSALNYGIEKMNGDYFSWLSHDDGYTCDKIKDSIDLLSKNNQLGCKTIAYTGGIFINSEGIKLYPFKEFFKKDVLYDGIQVINVFTKKGTINGCCMLIPKEVFNEVGQFDTSLRYSQDSLMWYKIFLNGYKMISDNKENVMCRLHSEQVSQTRRDLYEHDALVIAKILAEPLTKIDSTGKVFFNYFKRCTKNQCKPAIKFLYDYAVQNSIFSLKYRIGCKIEMIIGALRYYIAKIYKTILVSIRK